MTMAAAKSFGSSRLLNKVVVITGGAGGIGQTLTQEFLDQGARVVITGRNQNKLNQFIEQSPFQQAVAENRLLAIRCDGSNQAQLENCAQIIQKHFGKIDALINNAGSAGPKQEIAKIPIQPADLEALQAAGSTDNETLDQAITSLLGSVWLTTQTLLPYLNSGASVVNVSTIFSRTAYYGRTAYVVPKAALNVLTKLFARELGSDDRAIRFNTVYPGPVASERINNVFAAMDQLKKLPAGSTSEEVKSWMLQQKSFSGTQYLLKEEIAQTILFLASHESLGFTGHDFEVTHGIQVPQDSSTDVISRPNLRVVDLEGKLVWILAGDQANDGLVLAQKQVAMGAKVLLTLNSSQAVEVAQGQNDLTGIDLLKFDFQSENDWKKIDLYFYAQQKLPHATLVLNQTTLSHYYGDAVATVNIEKLYQFLNQEIAGAVVIAQRLDQIYQAADKRLSAPPVVIYISDQSNQQQNSFSQLKRAAVNQLIRIWRHENDLQIKNGQRQTRIRLNQLIRYQNQEPINLELCSEWAASLANGLRHIQAIDLALSSSLASSIQSQVPLNWERQALRGLHLRKVALITGGSEGIGKESARLLAIAGAKVVLAARDQSKLEKTRNEIIEELKLAGYSEPHSRVLIVPNCDVGDLKTLGQAIEQTQARFGRVDYLINNAGISGAEQMVVDMTRDEFKHTLRANLISNYDLLLRVYDSMKKQKSGHVLNISSHFGGVKNGTVAYPNRSDYAVSKAGQRALVEVLAPLLGPEIQINAVAPGPVDGIRLRGTDSRPGLYARRAKLIQENKRLNLVYGVLATGCSSDEVLKQALELLAINKIDLILKHENCMNVFYEMASLVKVSSEYGSCAQYFLTKNLYEKLLKRFQTAQRIESNLNLDLWLNRFQEAEIDFFKPTLIEREASKIKTEVVNTLALKRMPSENDVGREIVFYLANQNVTGETLHPSCGLTLEKLITSRELVGNLNAENLAGLKNQTVFILGDALGLIANKIVETLNEAGVKQVVWLKKTNGSVLEAFEQMRQQCGDPNVVISIPVANFNSFEGKLPSTSEFEQLIDDHILYHFDVIKRASLLDHCQVLVVTPTIAKNASKITKAFLEFVRLTLRPLVVTAAQENSRLLHKALVQQIEVQDDMSKMIEAIILLSVGPSKNKSSHSLANTITL